MRMTPISLAINRGAPRRPGLGASFFEDFTDGNETLDPRITFSRASNATVTGRDGLLRYARHNLLTFSEQFDNAAWTKTNATVTPNAIAAPDGSVTADKLIEDTTTSFHYVRPASVAVVSGAIITVSVYAKAGERSGFGLFPYNSAAGCRFNLVNGTVISQDAGVTASIVSVGNGWYRCIASIVASGTAAQPWFLTLNQVNATNYTGDGTSGLFIWGAQLEQNRDASTYVPTTVKNLLGFTQEFDNAAWTKLNAAIQFNQIRNNTMVGAVAGSPGTVPTGWYVTSTAGNITRTIVGTGVEDGVTYIEIRYQFSGPATAYTVPQQAATVTASAGQTWTASNYLKLVAGSLTNLIVRTTIDEYNASQVYLTGSLATFVPTSASLATQRPTLTRTLTDATTASVVESIHVVASGAADITLRIGMPQLVLGTSPGDATATTGTARAVQYTAPDGTPTAEKMMEDAANNYHLVAQYASAATLKSATVSLYCKASERSRLRIQTDSTAGTGNADFDLATGVVVASSGIATASSITNVGSQWYRCSVTFTSATAGIMGAKLVLGNAAGYGNSYTGDGYSGMLLWGAQISDSASADPYVYNSAAAPSSAITYGPRFDYDPVTRAPRGLLIEEQRTNLLGWSEQFDNAAWVKSSATVTANAVVAPDGSTTADQMANPSASSTLSYVTQTLSASITSTVGAYTVSVYAKSPDMISGRGVAITVRNPGSSAAVANFRLDAGNVGVVGTVVSGTNFSSPSATITHVGNGWYRCTLTFTVAVTVAAPVADVYYGVYGTSASSNGTLYVWGAQLEAGAFATSYIPTPTASTVTRAADLATITGTTFSSIFNQTEGTLVAAFDSDSSASARALAVDDGTVSNMVDITRTTSTGVAVESLSGGSYIGNINATIPAATSFKSAFAYSNTAVTDFATNGVANTGSLTRARSFTTLRLGIQANFSATLNGRIKQLAIYNRRMSSSELKALTS